MNEPASKPVRTLRIDAGRRFLAKFDTSGFTDQCSAKARICKTDQAERGRAEHRSRQNQSTMTKAKHDCTLRNGAVGRTEIILKIDEPS